jgi:hypothetical protein
MRRRFDSQPTIPLDDPVDGLFRRDTTTPAPPVEDIPSAVEISRLEAATERSLLSQVPGEASVPPPPPPVGHANLRDSLDSLPPILAFPPADGGPAAHDDAPLHPSRDELDTSRPPPMPPKSGTTPTPPAIAIASDELATPPADASLDADEAQLVSDDALPAGASDVGTATSAIELEPVAMPVASGRDRRARSAAGRAALVGCGAVVVAALAWGATTLFATAPVAPDAPASQATAPPRPTPLATAPKAPASEPTALPEGSARAAPTPATDPGAARDLEPAPDPAPDPAGVPPATENAPTTPAGPTQPVLLGDIPIRPTTGAVLRPAARAPVPAPAEQKPEVRASRSNEPVAKAPPAPAPRPEAAAQTAPVPAPRVRPAREPAPIAIAPDPFSAPAPAKVGAAEAAQTVATARRKLAADDAEGAEELMRQLLQNDPRNDQALDVLARALIDQDRGGAAAAVAEKLVALRPRTVSYWLVLGDALLMKGDDAGAKRAWQKALDLRPDDSGARQRLGL